VRGVPAAAAAAAAAAAGRGSPRNSPPRANPEPRRSPRLSPLAPAAASAAVQRVVKSSNKGRNPLQKAKVPKTGGRGAAWPRADTDTLLDICEMLKPIGKYAWERVAMLLNGE